MSQIYAEGGPASKFYPENRLPTFGKLFIFTKLQGLSGRLFTLWNGGKRLPSGKNNRENICLCD